MAEVEEKIKFDFPIPLARQSASPLALGLTNSNSLLTKATYKLRICNLK